MNIDEYFHKTLFASTIIIGPALAMTLPLVYWVQYRDMLFFPSFLYYVTGTGCISAMLYFALYVMPDSLKRLNGKKKPAKQILLLPPPAKSVEENKTSEEHHTAEPTIYNKVEEVPPVLSPSVPDTISKANQKETMMYKKFYYTYVEKYVRKYLSDENAQIVLEDIYLAIDNRALDLIVDGHKTRLPYEVKATSKFNSLNTEDIYQKYIFMNIIKIPMNMKYLIQILHALTLIRPICFYQSKGIMKLYRSILLLLWKIL